MLHAEVNLSCPAHARERIHPGFESQGVGHQSPKTFKKRELIFVRWDRDLNLNVPWFLCVCVCDR